MSKIKNGGLDQYGAEPFQHRQFGTAGVEGVKCGMYSVVYFTALLMFLGGVPVRLSQTSLYRLAPQFLGVFADPDLAQP